MTRTAPVLGAVAAAPVDAPGLGPRSGSILLVEDDRNIQRSISYQLNRQGYRLTCCADGEAGLQEALRRRYSVIVVDVMLPQLDGLSLCKQVRRARPEQPIILISARSTELDKITGLEFGADDYLAKPFSPAELEARIRALCRRASVATAATDETAVLEVGDVVLDCGRHELRVGGVAVRLTPKELALLRLLVGAPGRVFTRENLLAQVWGISFQGYHRAVDAHINRLKTKLQAQLGTAPEWLEGVYGAGYRFRGPNPE